MTLEWVPWRDEAASWSTARIVRVPFDDEVVVVFQAFSRAVGEHAVRHGAFGGPAWRLDRSTKLRTGFLPLMGRTSWGTAPDRDRVLAIHLRRDGFDELLRQAVHARFPPPLYASRRSWQLATRYAQVLFDWVPACDPYGAPCTGDTLRLELRDAALRRFSAHHVVAIESLDEHLSGADEGARVPRCRPYPIPETALAERLCWAGDEADEAEE